MGYKETGVIEVICKASDSSRVVYKNNMKMQSYQIFSSSETVTYCTGTEEMTEFEVELLRKIKSDEPLESEEKEKEQELLKSGISFEISENNPEMIYTDVTETEMLGFQEISKNVLTSQDNGLWAFHGLRKLKFVLSNLVEKDDKWNITAVLYFNKKDNDEISGIRMEKIAISQDEEDNIEDSSYTLYAYVDTNRLGDEFDKIQQKILFSGYLEVSFLSKEPEENDIIYGFPVELLLNNTQNEDCIPLQKKTVSIDFGTSSSCVAVEGANGGIELLTLSAREEGNEDINIYENPTCVMLYRWEELYEQWQKENGNLPLMVREDMDDEKNGKTAHFDFGYSVKKHLNEVGDKELNAIMTEIKMIPKMLHEGNQISVRPLRPQEKKVIDIVDSYEQQDEEKLDIVAFYGYLLGKAINRVERNKIYTSYQITYPVKFNEKVREKMKESLKAGLRRSLPLPIRKAVDRNERPIFQVNTKYAEPVAYIGSVCGKYLTLSEDTKAKMFAVYDFGGGTLDYSFGIFAQDPDDPMESNIHILGIDGDSTIGGELLIKRMSYWIYTYEMNKSVFIDNKIPFEKPENELLLDDFPEELFNKTASAKSNVRKINERISRNIFEGKEARETESDDLLTDDTEETKSTRGRKGRGLGNKKTGATIDFITLDEKNVPINISYDVLEINGRLREILKKTVSEFKGSLERTFESKLDVLKECGIDGFDIRDVHIFKAGNSSRNLILEELMREEFAENEILLVDETNSEFMGEVTSIAESKTKQVAVTPKTAVAFGQLKLGNFGVIDSYIKGDGKVFNWYVGVINRGNNQFKFVIDKVNPSQEWIKYGRINSIDMRIYYAEIPVEDADDTRLRSAELRDYLDEDNIQKDLYIKVKDMNTILCCVCERGSQPSGEVESFEVELQ